MLKLNTFELQAELLSLDSSWDNTSNIQDEAVIYSLIWASGSALEDLRVK